MSRSDRPRPLLKISVLVVTIMGVGAAMGRTIAARIAVVPPIGSRREPLKLKWI